MADEPAEQGSTEPSEEELRAQLEEEIRKVRVEDMVLQSAVSILNLAARRLAKDDERDLEQAKAGIDAAGALIEFVPEEAGPQLQQAVSELQLLYAKHADQGGAEQSGEGGAPAGEEGAEGPEQPPPKPKGDSGLWTPG